MSSYDEDDSLSLSDEELDEVYKQPQPPSTTRVTKRNTGRTVKRTVQSTSVKPVGIKKTTSKKQSTYAPEERSGSSSTRTLLPNRADTCCRKILQLSGMHNHSQYFSLIETNTATAFRDGKRVEEPEWLLVSCVRPENLMNYFENVVRPAVRKIAASTPTHSEMQESCNLSSTEGLPPEPTSYLYPEVYRFAYDGGKKGSIGGNPKILTPFARRLQHGPNNSIQINESHD